MIRRIEDFTFRCFEGLIWFIGFVTRTNGERPPFDLKDFEEKTRRKY